MTTNDNYPQLRRLLALFRDSETFCAALDIDPTPSICDNTHLAVRTIDGIHSWAIWHEGAGKYMYEVHRRTTDEGTLVDVFDEYLSENDATVIRDIYDDLLRITSAL